MSLSRTKRLRGWLVQFLAGARTRGDGKPRQYGIDMLGRFLAEAAMEAPPEEVARELAYLQGKGYVELERFSPEIARLLPGTPPMGARITSAGRDLVDGTVRDPGVDLGAFAE